MFENDSFYTTQLENLEGMKLNYNQLSFLIR